jgi:hypothetical protein
VKSFVLAVVDQFLKRHEFVSKQQENKSIKAQSPLKRVSRASEAPSSAVASLRSPAKPMTSQRPRSCANEALRPEYLASPFARFDGHHASVQPESSRPHTPSMMPPPQLVPLKRSTRDLPDDEQQQRTITPMRGNRYEDSGLAGDEGSRSRMTIESSGKRHKWIDDILKVRLRTPDE